MDQLQMINEYQTQSELNPKLWTNEEFNPKLRLQLLKIAKAFYKFLGITAKIKDVTLTGSNANYNWTTHSDIDLHLIIDYKEVDENDTLVRELMQSKKSLWNNTYPIEFKNMNIELYAQNAVEPHTSTGVFSLLNNNWIQKPDPKIVSVDDNEISTKAKPYEFEIDNLDPYEDGLLYKIQNIKSRLKHLRQTGLETVGEYSIENLAFKSLRNSGHLEKLSDLEKDITLTQLTPTLDEQWPSGPFGQEHDYANYGGPWGTGHHHKTDFKKGPGKTPTKSIGSGRSEEEKEDDKITGYKEVDEAKKKKSKIDMVLPRGEQKVLKAEDKDYKRGLLVKLLDNGGYEMAYWYDKPNKPYPVEIIVDGKSIKADGKVVEMKFHPKDYYDKQEKTKRLNKENFADGKNPGRKGLSQRVGIPKNATIAQLEKAAKSKGEKGRLARWQLNMRRGKK
jgi:hypothetical protein